MAKKKTKKRATRKVNFAEQQRSFLIAYFQRQTEAFAEVAGEDFKAPKVVKIKADAKTMKIAKAIHESDLGCKKASARSIIGAVIGKVIPDLTVPSVGLTGRMTIKPGAVVVVTREGDGHNYPLGKMAISVYPDDSLVREDGTIGNFLGYRSTYRLATRKEIAKMPQAQLDSYIARTGATFN